MSKNKNRPVPIITYPIITPTSNTNYTKVLINNQSSYSQQATLTANYAHTTNNSSINTANNTDNNNNDASINDANNNNGASSVNVSSNVSLLATPQIITTYYLVNPGDSTTIDIDVTVNSLEIVCDTTVSYQLVQTDALTTYVEKLIVIPANTMYSNGKSLSQIQTLYDIEKFGFALPSSYEQASNASVIIANNTKFNVGTVIPKYTTYYDGTYSYLITEDLVFTGFTNDSIGTNKFYGALLNGNSTLVQASKNSNAILSFMYLPAFFTIYKSALYVNDTAVSQLVNVTSSKSSINIINNTPCTIVISYGGKSYFILANTGESYSSNNINILIPAGFQKVTQDGNEIITLIDDIRQSADMQITHALNLMQGCFDDYYSDANLIVQNVLPSTTSNPALELYYVKKNTDIYNQTNQPIQVTSNSGTTYTIEIGCFSNFNSGALINMYTGSNSTPSLANTVVDTGKFLVVQSQMFGPVEFIPMPATSSGIIYNHTDRPVLVTAESGIVYSINPNSNDNYDMGAMILVYPDFLVQATEYCTNIIFNITNTDYNCAPVSLTQTPSNKVFNHTNKSLSVITNNGMGTSYTINIGESYDYNVGDLVYVYDDCTLETNNYCTNVLFNDGIFSKTGPGLLVAMPKTPSGNITNLTDRPVRVTSSSGTNYELSANSTDNYDMGAMILVYPLYSVTIDAAATQTLIINREHLYDNTIFNNQYGPALLYNLQEYGLNNIYNQTDKPLQVTSTDNCVHTIARNDSLSNVAAGAIIVLYPDNQIISKGGNIVVQSIDYQLRPNFDLTANANNNYYFSTNNYTSHRFGWTLLPNLASPQDASNFPSYAHMQGFYFDHGNTDPMNTKEGT